MAVNDQEFEFFAGERLTLRFPVIDASVTPNVPKNNLDTLSLFWGMVPQDDAGQFATSPLSVEKTTAAGITVDSLNGTNDRALVDLVRADTESLTPGAYHWELEAQDGGEPTVLATGTLTIKANLVNSA